MPYLSYQASEIVQQACRHTGYRTSLRIRYKMFRIAVSVIDNITNTNGTTVRARSVIRLLKGKYDVLLITRASSINDRVMSSLDLRKDAIKLVRPGGTKFWNLKLIPIILHNRFHVVYCVADIFGFFTYYLLSKILKFKIIFEAHALAHKEKEQTSKARAIIYFLVETFIGKNANAIIALSGVTYSFYLRLNKNTFFIPIFIDDKLFKNCSKKGGSVREKVVGLVGPFNIVPNKHQLDFLYANLDRFDKGIHFKIIGKCNRRLTNNRVEYTGYLESLEEYVRALCQLDALLVPVRIATFGPKNKILEAMACSLPVFSTPKATVGLDFAKRDKDLFVFEEYELADKLNSLIFNNELMKKIGNSARMVVEKYYSEAANSRKTVRILEKITNSEN